MSEGFRKKPDRIEEISMKLVYSPTINTYMQQELYSQILKGNIRHHPIC